MPIRVPQVTAQTAPALGPAPHMDPGFAGALASAPYRGLSDLAQTLAKSARDYAHVQDVLTREEMKLDVSDKLTQVRDRLAEEDVNLRQEGVDPDQLAEQFRQRGTRAISEVAKNLRYPQSRGAFQSAATKELGSEVIKQRYEGLKLKYARIGVLAEVANQEHVNQAIFGTPAQQADAQTALRQDAERLIATGVWSQEKGTSEVAGFLSQIQLGRARRDAQVPALRPAVIEDLLNGRLTGVKPGAQMDLAETLLAKEEAAQKALEQKATTAAEAERKRAVDELDDLADRGELSPERLTQARKDRVAVDDDFRRLAGKLRTGAAAGGRTDDVVYNRLELDLKENALSHSAKEIRRIQDEGKLAATGPRSAATLLTLIGDETTGAAAKDITQQPLFKEGIHDIRMSLRGGKGPLESLTGEEQGRLENAEREYHDIARSGKVGLSDLPETARKIIDRKRREVQPLMGGDPTGLARLRYTKPGDLLEAKKAGIISEAEFNRQFWLMESMGLFQKVEPGATTTPAAPKTPAKGKPSGGR